MLLRKILETNGRAMFRAGLVAQIELQNTRSTLVAANGERLHACVVEGLEGLFRKDREPTRLYGRALCDEVKMVFNCGGFFTSDELPKYGISRVESRTILAQTGCVRGDGNVVLLCAYNLSLSMQIFGYLIAHFLQELNAANTPD